MIRKALSCLAFLGFGALTAVGAHHNWFGIVDWASEPSVGEFSTLVVTDFDTAYTIDQFVELGGKINDDGTISAGSAVCPRTGSSEFKKVVGRVKTDFWGTPIGFELAASYQQKLRIKQAKGDMDWSEFEKAMKAAKADEQEGAESGSTDTASQPALDSQ